jgi:hypothetical protein
MEGKAPLKSHRDFSQSLNRFINLLLTPSPEKRPHFWQLLNLALTDFPEVIDKLTEIKSRENIEKEIILLKP